MNISAALPIELLLDKLAGYTGFDPVLRIRQIRVLASNTNTPKKMADRFGFEPNSFLFNRQTSTPSRFAVI